VRVDQPLKDEKRQAIRCSQCGDRHTDPAVPPDRACDAKPHEKNSFVLFQAEQTLRCKKRPPERPIVNRQCCQKRTERHEHALGEVVVGESLRGRREQIGKA
jgi:hypothetical protein